MRFGLVKNIHSPIKRRLKMVTVETKLSQINEGIKKKISVEELENILFNLGAEIEEVNGDNLKIDVTTERPDLVSTQGLIRYLSAYLGIKQKKHSIKKSNYKVIIDKSVEKVRPYTACAVIKNMNFNEDKIKEIIWVQEKLHATFGRNRKKLAIGIYPLEKIKMPIYYKATEPKKIRFIPLEENKELNGEEILVKTKTGKEYAHLLAGKTVFPYFIDDKNEILSMPPIINSDKTGRITKETKDCFIECSGFDFNTLGLTLNILTFMFEDLGGEIYSVELEYPDHKVTTPNYSNEKRTLTLQQIKNITGLDNLTIEDCKGLLEKMMYKVIKTTKTDITFEVLPIRADIWHDIDIIDDILRAYGVNNISSELPKVVSTANVIPENRLKKEIESLMTGLLFQEVFTFALTDKNTQFNKMNQKETDHIKLGFSAEQSINMVRINLLPELLKSLVANRNRELPQRLFEINDVVVPNNTKDVLCENRLRFSAVVCNETSDFTVIKQVLVYILESLGYKEYKFSECLNSSYIEGRCAKVTVNNKDIGFIGEISPIVLNNFELKVPVSAFEIELNK